MIAVDLSPGVRVTVAESLSHDLVKVSEWCDLLGMKLTLGRCFRGFVLQFWSTVLQYGARGPIHTINYWTV